MKIKTLSLLFMAGLMTAVTSCQEDKDDPNPLAASTGTVVTSLEDMNFPFFGGETTFSVEKGTAFIRPQADWLTYTKIKGDEDITGSDSTSVYKITCAVNEDFKYREDSVLVNQNGKYKWIKVTQAGPVKKDSVVYTFRSAQAIAQDMYPGWNLGNTMEATSDIYTNKGGYTTETSWQSTLTSQAIIDAVKAAGFKSVRIPVAWIAGHVTGTRSAPVIDPYWMERVKEIVDYCLNDGLYVVINDHYDGAWLETLGFSNSTSAYEKVNEDTIAARKVTLNALWTQIANEFQNYDEHVLFAGLNEPFQEYSVFNGKAAELTPILNEYNEEFVKAVRATGMNNANRILVVQGSGASIDYATTNMLYTDLPEDPGKLMVEIHYYDPGQFCGTYNATGDNAYYYWGQGNHGNDHNPTYGEEDYMQAQFAKLRTSYVAHGYPVIIGEYACQQRTLTATGTDQAKHDASVKAFYKAVNQYAINNGCVPFAWDTNDTAGLLTEAGSSTIIDRKNAAVKGTNAMAGIIEGCKAGVWYNK